ncbi:MAG: DUF4056 domain-containing protein [Mariniphaga sp.]|nr:DUF4056 domain-containing protein [Mariniphaga sp.]
MKLFLKDQHISKFLAFGILLVSSAFVWAKPPLLTNRELLNPPPKVIRTCCAFGTDLSIARIPFIKMTDIISLEDVGSHYYLGHKDEINGIIYTRKGGFIDLGHLRDYADYTAYLYTVIRLYAANKSNVVLELGHEGGHKKLIINNPHEIDSMVLFELAGKIAYDLSLWHEIATWFGCSYVPLIPERYSSFSPEDLYSNLLGVKLGIQSLKSDLEYNEAMKMVLSETLVKLEAVKTIEETYLAMEQVENIWWTREKPLPSSKVLLTRYLDSGSSLKPWLLPDETNSYTPHILDIPDPSLTRLYQLNIKINRKFPWMTPDSQNPDRTIDQNDFEWFVDHIRNNQKKITPKRTES